MTPRPSLLGDMAMGDTISHGERGETRRAVASFPSALTPLGLGRTARRKERKEAKKENGVPLEIEVSDNHRAEQKKEKSGPGWGGGCCYDCTARTPPQERICRKLLLVSDLLGAGGLEGTEVACVGVERRRGKKKTAL